MLRSTSQFAQRATTAVLSRSSAAVPATRSQLSSAASAASRQQLQVNLYPVPHATAARFFSAVASAGKGAGGRSRSSRWGRFAAGAGIAALTALVAAETVFCADNSSDAHGRGVSDKDKKSTAWKQMLPETLWPSKNPKHAVNAANAPPQSQSSLDSIRFLMPGQPLDSQHEHTGDHIAMRGAGREIMLANSSVAAKLAEDAILALPVEEAILTKAPKVPPPIERDYPVLLKVNLETTAKVMQLTNRLKYEFWTFNDMVPGPMIRARVGDVVELNLKNTDVSGNPHNIDCHGFDGPGGGAPITTAQQDETKTARFKCLYPGLYIYHCAAAPVPAHIMNGMYGMVLIEPEFGKLPAVDREYYVLQSEFYHEPLDPTGGNSLVEPSYPRGLDETPDVFVFNGKEGALTTDAPLQAKTGETVRIYFGNAGPNKISSFHVIGGVFEKVYRDGDIVSPPGRFIQTVLVPPGGATVVDMHLLIPGTYTLVDHAIFRLDKGAVGYLNVTGKDRPDLYGGGDPQPCPGCKLHP